MNKELGYTGLAKLRRHINHSHIGQVVNNTTPGILFEGMCRQISDVVTQLKCEVMPYIRYLRGEYTTEDVVSEAAVPAELLLEQYKEGNPLRHHSWVSPLYEMVNSPKGAYMKRVPVRDVLMKR